MSPVVVPTGAKQIDGASGIAPQASSWSATTRCSCRARKGAGRCRPNDEEPAHSQVRHGTRSIIYEARDANTSLMQLETGSGRHPATQGGGRGGHTANHAAFASEAGLFQWDDVDPGMAQCSAPTPRVDGLGQQLPRERRIGRSISRQVRARLCKTFQKVDLRSVSRSFRKGPTVPESVGRVENPDSVGIALFGEFLESGLKPAPFLIRAVHTLTVSVS